MGLGQTPHNRVPPNRRRAQANAGTSASSERALPTVSGVFNNFRNINFPRERKHPRDTPLRVSAHPLVRIPSGRTFYFFVHVTLHPNISPFCISCWEAHKGNSGLTQLTHVPHKCVCVWPVMFNSCVTPWTVAHQAPLSMGFSKREHCRGLPCPSPGDLPDPGMEPTSLASPALAGGFFITVPPGKPQMCSLLFKVSSGSV